MKKEYQILLLEEIRDQNKALLEGQKDQATRTDIHRLESRLGKLETDVEAIKVTVKATNHDVTHLEHRVARLETA